MKYCKDCKWRNGLSGCCRHEKAMKKVDLETGKATSYYCENFRKYGGCGREARYFEQKVSFWARLKDWFEPCSHCT